MRVCEGLLGRGGQHHEQYGREQLLREEAYPWGKGGSGKRKKVGIFWKGKVLSEGPCGGDYLDAVWEFWRLKKSLRGVGWGIFFGAM